MKNINKFFAGFGVLLALASCDKLNTLPEFKEEDSFAAFGTTYIAVNENVGKISIPVTIASIDPVATNVTYKVVDGTAKEGVNFKLSDPSAVLRFDGKAREMNIDLDVIEKKGEFTGDLEFTILIENAGEINLGEGIECKVSIKDLDHPLASILGNYSAVVPEYFDKADASWDFIIDKDGESLTSVIISSLDLNLSSLPYPAPSSEMSAALSANVDFDEEGKIIGLKVPLGQVLGYKFQGKSDILFWEFLYEDGEIADANDSGNLYLKLVEEGKFVCEQGYGFFIPGAGTWDAYFPGGVFTKK